MTITVFNWTDEKQAFLDFLGKDVQVLHVRGGDDHYVQHFVKHVLHPQGQVICTIDPWAGNNSPLTALKSIADTLKIPRKERRFPSITSNVGNDAKAGGDVHISNVTPTFNLPGPNEWDEASEIRDEILEHLTRCGRLDGLILFFLDCHVHDEAIRRKLHRWVYEGVVMPLLGLGARVVFQYDETLASIPAAIPPIDGLQLQLPVRYDARVVPQISEYGARQGWSGTDENRIGRAGAFVDVSGTVRALYENLALPRISEMEPK